MSTREPLMICEHCDTVYRRRRLVRGEVAQCARCRAVLERHHGMGSNTLLALLLTGFIAFVVANVWPVVTLALGSKQISTTLWGTVITMWQEHSQIVAVLAAATLFFFPLIRIVSMSWLYWYARDGRRAPGFVPIMVTIHYLKPWTMSEVFVLGALVAIVKARVYFEVIADPGIYAYGVLTLLITAFAAVDVRRLWDTTSEQAA